MIDYLSGYSKCYGEITCSINDVRMLNNNLNVSIVRKLFQSKYYLSLLLVARFINRQVVVFDELTCYYELLHVVVVVSSLHQSPSCGV